MKTMFVTSNHSARLAFGKWWLPPDKKWPVDLFYGCQVITGGHYDVDCIVKDPLGSIIYSETKKQYDSFTHKAEVKGVYQFCFSNEFSTFSHKTVYFDFQVGDEPPILPDMGNRVTALTQVSGHQPQESEMNPLFPPPPPACSSLSVVVLADEQSPATHLPV